MGNLREGDDTTIEFHLTAVNPVSACYHNKSHMSVIFKKGVVSLRYISMGY